MWYISIWPELLHLISQTNRPNHVFYPSSHGTRKIEKENRSVITNYSVCVRQIAGPERMVEIVREHTLAVAMKYAKMPLD